MGLVGRRGAVMLAQAELEGSATMALEAAELLGAGGRVSDSARALVTAAARWPPPASATARIR